MSSNQSIPKIFGGRNLVIATRHQKEQVLRPIMESQLGVQVLLPENLDTDDFGTFSGEVEREGSPLDTARRKCIAAHELTGESLVLASEGSFGAHPVLGFIPADEELLLLKDFRNQIEYKAKVISTQTNFGGNDYYEWEHVLYFASQVNFPSHGLILRASKEDYSEIHKGITSWDRLKESFHHFHRKYRRVYVETDMRALYNPTRMKVIAEAGTKLISVIHSFCPVCEGPGYDVREVIRGLPCGLCQTPTQSAKAHVYVCPHCGHSETRVASEKKLQEDPMFCDTCNP